MVWRKRETLGADALPAGGCELGQELVGQKHKLRTKERGRWSVREHWGWGGTVRRVFPEKG